MRQENTPSSPGKHFINCGTIGRPANDGQTTVLYTIISADNAGRPKVDFIRLAYDHERLAAEMASRGFAQGGGSLLVRFRPDGSGQMIQLPL